MITESKATRYQASCDNCDWAGSKHFRKSMAEHELGQHKCGEHRPTYGDGSFRGILGGFNRDCVCGAHWVTDEPGLGTWSCPKATTP